MTTSTHENNEQIGVYKRRSGGHFVTCFSTGAILFCTIFLTVTAISTAFLVFLTTFKHTGQAITFTLKGNC